MPRVLVTPAVLRDLDGPYRAILRDAGFEMVLPTEGRSLMDPAALIAELDGIDGVIASIEPYNREVLEGSRLRIVARTGVGYDSVDLDAATELGIVVTTTPGTNHDSVAETAIALITGVFRGMPWRNKEMFTGRWTRRALPRLAGQTIGLVGLGRIGKAMVGRCQGLGLAVVAYDPLAEKDYAAANGVSLLPLDDLLATADIVSLHLPATAETTNLINGDTLAQMKRGAVLINTSRGALVDEAALADALRTGHLMAAGLDVFQTEPLPTDSPLLEIDNLLMLPHVGGLDLDSQQAMATLAAQCVADIFAGRWPEACVVNGGVRPEA